MASKIGMAVRQERAQARIDAAVDALTAASGLEIAPLAAMSRIDPVLRATLRDEWIADTLEAVTAHLTAAAAEPEDAAPTESGSENADDASDSGDAEAPSDADAKPARRKRS